VAGRSKLLHNYLLAADVALKVVRRQMFGAVSQRLPRRAVGVQTGPWGKWFSTVNEHELFTMNELEQLARDVRGFAAEVRRLGYSSVAGGRENQFLELSERMIRHADEAKQLLRRGGGR
jgi:hypothetical protein